MNEEQDVFFKDKKEVFWNGEKTGGEPKTLANSRNLAWIR